MEFKDQLIEVYVETTDILVRLKANAELNRNNLMHFGSVIYSAGKATMNAKPVMALAARHASLVVANENTIETATALQKAFTATLREAKAEQKFPIATMLKAASDATTSVSSLSATFDVLQDQISVLIEEARNLQIK